MRVRGGLIPVLMLSLGLVSEPACAAEAQDATAYGQIVTPIFQARCFSCHGEEKKKGKLALHTWERVAQGGDSGPLFVAGKPAESELVRRLRLPLDDEEHMPPKEEPQLSAEEISLLVRWIERGAKQKGTVGELKLEPALAKALAELSTKLAEAGPAGSAEPAWEFDPAAVEKSRAPLAAKVTALQQQFPGALSYESRTSAALHFTGAGLGRDFGDKQLAALAAVGEAVVTLDLSGTAVTDKSAALLGRFAELRVLRLGFTGVGDATVAQLGRLGKLETLVLSRTAVTAAGLPTLAKLQSLKRLHLGDAPLAQVAKDAKLPVVEMGAPEPVAAQAVKEAEAPNK